MSKSTAPVVAATPAALKVPTVVANEIAAVEYAMDATVMRSRPVVAINENGELVVCCKTTAKKHGWEVQGKLYVRTRSGKSASISAKGDLVATPAPEAKTPRTPGRRGSDTKVASAAKKVAAALHTVEELLK